eukprot:TRINITY_DN1583_c0_g1_i1.p1 TRINITY_DN1583_c0_g1~~TRINITY_DN1583_c0_g1_i1.p1  ORF type:complete len:504 (-),score=168.79 TRINITY_DN1583_c0_g1_i1:75-1547(-)
MNKKKSKRISDEIKIWHLLHAMTISSEWYERVFDEKIIKKWLEEVTEQVNSDKKIPKDKIEDSFYTALRILRTSAQGVSFAPVCTWGDDTMCKNCEDLAISRVKSDPNSYDIDDIATAERYELIEAFSDVNDNFCNHVLCECTAPDHKLSSYVSYTSEGLVPKELREKLLESTQKMMEKIPIDWHPGSDEKVRDLIHPSMYCYVKGVSSLKDGKVEEKVDERFQYQWLPSEFGVDKDGKVKVNSYINNLDTEQFPEFSGLVGELFESYLPSFEKVVKKNLKGKNLQVIVKVGSTHLKKEKKTFGGGSWHVEGMVHERIVASGIHYLKVEGITESFLEFRKPTIINEKDYELGYPQSNSKFTTHHYGISPGSHHEGQMNRYLGLIKCQEGASVVFPNTLQHHVKNFSLEEGKDKGERIIIAFFLIDPDHRIISTSDVLPQQKDSKSKEKSKVTFTEEEAKHHRERLMFHRKYFVDLLNKKVYERSFSLCEH